MTTSFPPVPGNLVSFPWRKKFNNKEDLSIEFSFVVIVIPVSRDALRPDETTGRSYVICLDRNSTPVCPEWLKFTRIEISTKLVYTT